MQIQWQPIKLFRNKFTATNSKCSMMTLPACHHNHIDKLMLFLRPDLNKTGLLTNAYHTWENGATEY